MRPPSQAYMPYILLTLLCLPLLFVNTFSSHDWGGDFAQYIAQGINVVEGAPQGETGYIYNPQNAMLAPPAYPVGFPLILSGVYAIAGNDIYAFSFTIAVFIILLGLICVKWFRQQNYGSFLAIVLAIAVVYNPWMIRFKLEIRSDIPFAFFLLLFVVLYSRKSRDLWWQSLLLGAVGGFLLCVRSIGFVIILAVGFDLLQRWWKHRKTNNDESTFLGAVQHPFLVIASIIGFYFLMSTVLFPVPSAASPYPNLFTWDSIVETLQLNLEYYYLIFLRWFKPYSENWKWIPQVMSYMALGLMALGMIRKWIKEFNWIDVLVLSYLGVLFVFPYRAAGMRFLLPLVPFFLLYMVKGVEGLSFGLRYKLVYVALAFGLLIAGTYRLQFQRAAENQDYVIDGPQKEYAQSFWSYVKENTAEDARFVFIKPRVLALYADREAMANAREQNVLEMEAQFREVGIDYLVVHDEMTGDLLKTYVAENPGKVELDWENDRIKLYKWSGN